MLQELTFFCLYYNRKATKLFENIEDALDCMEEYGFDMARAELLEKAGKVVDAAELHLLEGRTIKAINLLLQDRVDERALPRAIKYLLDALWECLPFGAKPSAVRDSPDSILDSLLQVADAVIQAANPSKHEETQVRHFF